MPDVTAPDPQRLVSAAFRLKHDVGKAVRWNAGAGREKDPEMLRHRLEVDLVRTRSGNDGVSSAVELFDVWMAEDGPLFRGMARYEQRLARMAEAIEEIRARLPRLSELGRGELVLLDEASLLLHEESRALWRDVVSSTAGSAPA